MKLKELPDFEKPREKMLHGGAASLSDAELIALLISSGTKDESSIFLASKILALEPEGLKGFSN